MRSCCSCFESFQSPLGASKTTYIYLVGSAAKTGSSWNGVMSIGAPLFQRPTILAPTSSLPSSGDKTFSFPSLCTGLFFRKSSNSGTCWKSQRKTTKLPSVDQSFLMVMPGSPFLPVTITPGCTGLGPGWITVSNPITAGLEIPSSKPKLGLGLVDIHIEGIWKLTAHVHPQRLVGRHPWWWWFPWWRTWRWGWCRLSFYLLFRGCPQKSGWLHVNPGGNVGPSLEFYRRPILGPRDYWAHLALDRLWRDLLYREQQARNHRSPARTKIFSCFE